MNTHKRRKERRKQLNMICSGHGNKVPWYSKLMPHDMFIYLGEIPHDKGIKYIDRILKASIRRLNGSGIAEPDMHATVLNFNMAEERVVMRILNWPRPGWDSGDGDSEHNVSLTDAVTLYMLGGWTREHPSVTEAKATGKHHALGWEDIKS